jgi:dienelactone hydrolase
MKYALVLSVVAAFMPSAVRSEPVTFAGEGLTIRAELSRPAGPGPFPAVVALHGCAGLYGKRGGLAPRHADWAERLVAQGYLVLFPDSFGSRGAGAQCRTDDRVTRPARERVADALAAKTYLQSRPDVKPDAISLLGWSNGAATVLHAVGRAGAENHRPAFASAVAFYPGCRPLLGRDWHARIPLLILIGAADDWTAATPCEALVQRAKASAEPASIIVYPGAYHDFDHPKLSVHVSGGLAFTSSGSASAHSGTDPAARADALGRVPAFLAK